MASYGNFQSDNQKYSKKSNRIDTSNPDFNPAVDVVGKESAYGIKKNLKKWAELVAWCRWNIDGFYDLITPETGALIKLGLDQRVILRSLARFKSSYCVLARGSGKTLLSMMYAFHTCIFYPTVEVSLTAQTRENAAKLINDKFDELLRAFPLLKEEIYSSKFSKDTAVIEFHNGSKISNLANNQSSKGAHVQRGIVDEDNLTDEETYLDVLEPIFTTVPRKTVGKLCVRDPNEMNGSISQLTSSGFRGSSAFYRCVKHLENMVNLKGEMCFGASWELQEFYGRGATKAEILKKKETNSSISFDMNYRAVWTGASTDSLVTMSKLLSCRTLSNCELKGNPSYDYVLGVDIARSDNSNNNQTSIAVLKAVRRQDGRIKEVHLVNMYAISGTLDFNAQAIEIKRIKEKYNASVIVVDDNGLGKGTVDAAVRDQVDPSTGKSLGCYDTINSERIPEVAGSPKIIFCYMAQKYDNKSIQTFMDCVETGKLRLLEKKDLNSYDDFDGKDERLNKMAFVQTDFFVEEVSNLKLKHLSNGGLSIDRLTKNMNKDRFSAVQYGLWYIMEYMDNVIEQDERGDLDYLLSYLNY